MRLQLSVPAYNLGNLWRRLGLPQRIKNWSLTSLQHRLMKTGGRLVKHARYNWLLLAEGYLNRELFGEMLGRIWALPRNTRSGACPGSLTSRRFCDATRTSTGQSRGSEPGAWVVSEP